MPVEIHWSRCNQQSSPHMRKRSLWLIPWMQILHAITWGLTVFMWLHLRFLQAILQEKCAETHRETQKECRAPFCTEACSTPVYYTPVSVHPTEGAEHCSSSGICEWVRLLAPCQSANSLRWALREMPMRKHHRPESGISEICVIGWECSHLPRAIRMVFQRKVCEDFLSTSCQATNTGLPGSFKGKTPPPPKKKKHPPK